jgi:hypothetical protein
MEAHRRKQRRAQRSSGGSRSSRSSDDEDEERQVLGLAAAWGVPGAWWTVQGSGGSLAGAALSPKVYRVEDWQNLVAPIEFGKLFVCYINAFGSSHSPLGSGFVCFLQGHGDLRPGLAPCASLPRCRRQNQSRQRQRAWQRER